MLLRLSCICASAVASFVRAIRRIIGCAPVRPRRERARARRTV